jgi:hypothetical protein
MKYGEEAVYALLDLLNEHEVSYMLVGSFSSNAYGEARATKDADFVVDLDSKVRLEILKGLPDDFEIDWQVNFETITGHTRQILKIPSIPFEIELFDISSEPFDQSRFQRRRKTTLEDRVVWLPTAEDVVVQKLRWATLGKREKDMLDVVGILKVRRERLDFDYIREWCAKLELLEALAEAESRATSH